MGRARVVRPASIRVGFRENDVFKIMNMKLEVVVPVSDVDRARQ